MMTPLRRAKSAGGIAIMTPKSTAKRRVFEKLLANIATASRWGGKPCRGPKKRLSSPKTSLRASAEQYPIAMPEKRITELINARAINFLALKPTTTLSWPGVYLTYLLT
jgi:hypothetical protein